MVGEHGLDGFYGQGDALLEAAFASCVMWAARNSEMREAFEEDTGMRPPGNNVEAMIDEATGYDKERAEAFVEWVIKNVWGKQC